MNRLGRMVLRTVAFFLLAGVLLPGSAWATREVIGSNGLRITVEPRFKTLSGAGDTARFGATCQFPNQPSSECTNQVTWTVTNPSVAAFGTTKGTKNRLITLASPALTLVKAVLGDAVSNGVLVLIDLSLEDPVDIFCHSTSSNPVCTGVNNSNCTSAGQRTYSGPNITPVAFVDFCAVCTVGMTQTDCTGAVGWNTNLTPPPGDPPPLFFLNDANGILNFQGTSGQYQIATQGFAEIKLYRPPGPPSENRVSQGAAILTNLGNLTGIALTPAGSVIRDVGAPDLTMDATCTFGGITLNAPPCATLSSCSCKESAVWVSSRPAIATFGEPKFSPGRLDIAPPPANRGFTKITASLFGVPSPSTVVVVPNRGVAGTAEGFPIYGFNALTNDYMGTTVVTNDVTFSRFYLIDAGDGNIVTSLSLAPADGLAVQGHLPVDQFPLPSGTLSSFIATTAGKIIRIDNVPGGAPGPQGNSLLATTVIDGSTINLGPGQSITSFTTIMTGRAAFVAGAFRMTAVFLGAIRTDGTPVFVGIEVDDLFNPNGTSRELLLNFPAPTLPGPGEIFGASPGVTGNFVFVPSDFDCPFPPPTGGCVFRFTLPVPPVLPFYPTQVAPTATRAVSGDARLRSVPAFNRWDIVTKGPFPELRLFDFNLLDTRTMGSPIGLTSSGSVASLFVRENFPAPGDEIYFGDEGGSVRCFTQTGSPCSGFPAIVSASPVRDFLFGIFAPPLTNSIFALGSAITNPLRAFNAPPAAFPGVEIVKDGYPYSIGGGVVPGGIARSSIVPPIPRLEIAIGSNNGIFFVPLTTCTTCAPLPPPSDPPFPPLETLPLGDAAFYADPSPFLNGN